MNVRLAILITAVLFFQCNRITPEPEGPQESASYFPPTNSEEWQTLSFDELSWDENAKPALLNFLKDKDTRAFLILKDGKIVIEEYWNKGLLGGNFNQNTNWYWASAAKSMTSFLIGQAQDEGLIDIENSSSDYLGKGWSSLTEEQEEAIKVRHHLSMTTGLNDQQEGACTTPDCLTYFAPPGERWAYHNGPYTILDRMIEDASEESFDSYFERSLKDKIGMDGFWTYQGFNHVYYSTARSMARFGLLVQNDGKWQDQSLLDDLDFLQNSLNSSQEINPSYGYLWWLNGKSTYMLPGSQETFSSDLVPNAPSDMVSALGKNSQIINVVPSQNLIVIRMGGDPDDALVPLNFIDDMWKLINDVLEP